MDALRKLEAKSTEIDYLLNEFQRMVESEGEKLPYWWRSEVDECMDTAIRRLQRNRKLVS